jgi:zinc/manganese transport system ATP-binding protein
MGYVIVSTKVTPHIVMRNVTLGYERHPAVHHLSMDIEAGSLLAVVGPNGAGKSTLIKALAGTLPLQTGTIEGPSPNNTAWLSQVSTLDTSFPIDVQGMVMMGLWRHPQVWGWRSATEKQRCLDALAAVGLSGFERRSLNSLSGGQLQRARFARLILQDAPVILLDEPFAAVDQRTTDDLLQLLHRWHEQGKTVIAVLHDLTQVHANFPLTLLLAREPVAWGATAEVLTAAHWQRAQAMREPFDESAPVCEVAH